MTANRGATSQKELKIDWTYPVYTPPEQSGKTRAPSVSKSLDIPMIYEVLAKDDKRPLLVLREFSTFDNPDNEKLSRKLYTEKTVLLSHYFNCIRLPHHVTEPEHPFNGLFQENKPPQLFLASADGTLFEPFEFNSSRANLLKDMNRILDKYYVKNPTKVINDLFKLLPKFDKLDLEIQDLKEDLDRAIEEKGPLSSRARKLQKELDRAEKERKNLEKKKAALREIPLKNTVASNNQKG